MRLREIGKVFAVTLLVVAVLESLLRVAYDVRNAMVAAIPLPYMVGDEYGPVPPWVDGLRILEPDATLLWRSRPNLHRRYIDVFGPVDREEDRGDVLRRFLPSLPTAFRGSSVWEISLNSQGFRDGEFPQEKSPSAFRILCLGDSWTFGANVGQMQAYPQRLRTLLRREFPGAAFEVFNLGVLGYSSYQGLEVLRRSGLGLHPDLVVIAYGMNDGRVAGFRDKDLAGRRGLPAGQAIGHLFERSEVYKALRYAALVFRHRPKSIGEHLRAMATSVAPADLALYERLEPWTRVSPADYEQNLRAMIALARGSGAAVLLLYNALERQGPYRAILGRVSRAAGVALIDSSALLAQARRQMEADLEDKLNLHAPPRPRGLVRGETEVVFRVYLGNRPVPRRVFIVGTHPKLGDLVPNRVALYDDGTHGDQRARDTVWSLAATFPAGTRLVYVYTNSGGEGRWEGLDVPAIRHFAVEAPAGGERTYRPIETFGTLYLQADHWHTDAAGNDLIARALLAALAEHPKVRAYLQKVAEQRS